MDPDPSSPGLLPAGRRWGQGARSVVPYLVRSLEMRPTAAQIVIGGEEPIRNPVFRRMDIRVAVQQKKP